jgi:hypothetical protein
MVTSYVGVTLIVGNSTGACMLCSDTDCSAVAAAFPRTCLCTDKVCNERHTACIVITTPYSPQAYKITQGPLANRDTEVSQREAKQMEYIYSKATTKFYVSSFWHGLLQSLNIPCPVASLYWTSHCLTVRTLGFKIQSGATVC